MDVRTIAVESHRIENIKDLTLFMQQQAQREPDYFRRLARLDILPDGSFVVEDTPEALTFADKEGLVRLADPTEKGAIYVLAIQQQGGTRVITVDDRTQFSSPRLANNAAPIVDALTKPFPQAHGRIALAPGNSVQTYSFMGNGLRLTDMGVHQVTDVVAVPENLGGGFVARSTEYGRCNQLWRLTAKQARSGHFSAGSWKPVAEFEYPITSIGLRFYGTSIIVTVEGQGLKVVNAARIASQTVSEIAETGVRGVIRALGPIAEVEHAPTTTGLFTQVDSSGQPQTYLARLGQDGLPQADFATV
ncbi:hypothetical protein HYW17_00435 [Candidatus Uhrbacteria bacterium]|nr:hypothetical protein [Candidatus Uhrbacteria bacterium]